MLILKSYHESQKPPYQIVIKLYRNLNQKAPCDKRVFALLVGHAKKDGLGNLSQMEKANDYDIYHNKIRYDYRITGDLCNT